MEPWIQTYNGKKFNFIEPDSDMIDIEDIAHALSMQCRHAGHSRYFFSIAEHSILVSSLLPTKIAIAGLLHNAAEAYITDIPTPLKDLLPNYRWIKMQVQKTILKSFRIKLSDAEHKTIKLADAQVLKIETSCLIPKSCIDNCVEKLPASIESESIEINAWKPTIAKAVFLDNFYKLINGVKPIPHKKSKQNT